jgi:hypothetical protein
MIKLFRKRRGQDPGGETLGPGEGEAGAPVATDAPALRPRVQFTEPPPSAKDDTALNGHQPRPSGPGTLAPGGTIGNRLASTIVTRPARHHPDADHTVTQPRAEKPPERADRILPPPARPAAPPTPPPQRRAEAADMPRFRLSPSDLSRPPEQRPILNSRAAEVALWEAFTPTQPKQWSRLFAGRLRQVERVITAIEEERAHVVIYGERGLGKTSLSNIIAESAGQAGYHVLRCACSSGLGFEDMFREFLRQIPRRYMGAPRPGQRLPPAHEIESFDELLPAGQFGPTELTNALRHLGLEHFLFLIDEFDRVALPALKNNLAETIKNLSDVGARVTFVVVGVAHTLDELLGSHPSIQRNLISVHLPLMERSELQTLIRMGEKASGIRFDDIVRERIVLLSKGLPYYTQLLCLHSGRSALDRGSQVVEKEDLDRGVDIVLAEADPVVVRIYEMATRGERRDFVTEVVFAAAACRGDPYGAFTAESAAAVPVDAEGRRIPALTLHKALTALTTDEAGPMLAKQRNAAGEMRYQFINQTMRQYILLRQARLRGLI